MLKLGLARSGIEQHRDHSTGDTLLNPLDLSIPEAYPTHNEPKEILANSIIDLFKKKFACSYLNK